MTTPPIQALFLDVGGVLLSNGWDHHARQRVAAELGYDYAEVEARHQVVTDVHECGKITLKDYLQYVVFYTPRPFTPEQYRELMYASSTADQAMIDLLAGLKKKHGLKVYTVNNEARELNAYRITTFGLDHWVDAFVSSCYVGTRKPDAAIFRLALDLAQVPPEQVIYIDNTALLVEIAKPLGMHGLVHTDYASTRDELLRLGLD